MSKRVAVILVKVASLNIYIYIIGNIYRKGNGFLYLYDEMSTLGLGFQAALFP